MPPFKINIPIYHDKAFQTDLSFGPVDHNVSKLIRGAIIHCSSGALRDRLRYCRRKSQIIWLANTTHPTSPYIYKIVNSTILCMSLTPPHTQHACTHAHAHTCINTHAEVEEVQENSCKLLCTASTLSNTIIHTSCNYLTSPYMIVGTCN